MSKLSTENVLGVIVATLFSIIIGGLILFIGLLIWEDVFPPKQTKTVYYDYGHVTKVTDCDAGKYSYECWLLTNKVTFKSKTDVTDYPGQMVEVGDSLGFQEIYFDNGKIEFFKCRNKLCSSYATHLWYMPHTHASDK